LDSFTSDIRHLVAYGDMRARLPQSFAGHFIRWTDYASAGLARATRVWAYRDLLLARLAGIPAVRSFEKSGDANAWGVDDPRVLDFRGPHDSVCVSWELFDEYVQAASAGAGRKVFVFMPLQPGRRVLYPEFARRAGERLDGTGLEFWDLSWTLPPQRFLTPTHLDETGHRLLARILLEKLTR
jgi:hypothetical protein